MTTRHVRLARNPKGAGRPPGAPTRVNYEFRETVRQLLEKNQHKVSKWLDIIAEGDPAFGTAPDPAKALELLAKLAEFAAPKLGRVEHMGEDGGPLQHITHIEIEFVDAKAPSAYIEAAVNGNAGLPAPN